MKTNDELSSKLTDWLRGTPKPASGTAEEWKAWEKIAKTKKIRYWLVEDGLDHLKDFIFWPANRLKDLRNYISNRWVSKTHCLASNLQRGQWHDLDTRLLHAVFDELVNFVEIEQAWMLVACDDNDRKKYKAPWYRTIFRIGRWRCPEAGLAHLEWAAGLKYNEDWFDKNDPNYGQPTPQALAAQETLALYKWWKEERPKRPKPSEASGWSSYCEKKYKAAELRGEDSSLSFLITKKEEKERTSSILDIYHKIIAEQEEEDTAMLIRLVKNRGGLWT